MCQYLTIINPLAAINVTSQNPILEGADHKTLVYFASGPYKKKYESLPFDRIYLVDYCFAKNRNQFFGISDQRIKVSKSGKVICLGMDCLDAVNYLTHFKVKIDCMVSLTEGIFEGGAPYPINGDFFLGYLMPILSDEYIHIMNKKYYCNHYHVTMDLPYQMTEIKEEGQDYLDPLFFSANKYHKGNAKVFRMKKDSSVEDLKINANIQFSIFHDSIWNYKDELDLLVISFTSQGQGNFFHRLNKVISIRDLSIEQIFDLCVQKRIEKIGFVPWKNGNYSSFIDQIKDYKYEYPKVISLFHLNRKDFKSVKYLS